MMQALTDLTAPITQAWNLFLAHSIFGVVVFLVVLVAFLILFSMLRRLTPWTAVLSFIIAFFVTALLINGLYNSASLTLLALR
jgi:hypothetical protein